MGRLCFFLTNSRSLKPPDAVALNGEIIRNLNTAANTVGRPFSVVSRSDSTLRGHFPGEVGAVIEALDGKIDGTVLVPAFIAEEIHVDRLTHPAERDREIERVASRADAAIGAGRHSLLYTSRRLGTALGRAGDLDVAQTVSSTLVAIVRAIKRPPRFFIAKGGIASSDLATKGLGKKKALALDQAAPRVPVWRLGPETRFPGMTYVVFPGNVGAPETLRDMVTRVGA